jgi:hypothetical protein
MNESPQHCAQKRLPEALNEGIGTEKRPWSDAFPGAHLVLDLWRYADFPLLIAASEFQITSVRGRQSIWNFGHHFPQPRFWSFRFANPPPERGDHFGESLPRRSPTEPESVSIYAVISTRLPSVSLTTAS